MASLRLLDRADELQLRGKITLMGRDPHCDIVIGTGQTSWRHAMIVRTGSDFFIEDLDSVNGTFINGRRIKTRTLLHPNDRLDICGFSAVFVGDAPAAPAADQTIAASAVKLDRGAGPILSSLDAVSGHRFEVKPEVKLRAVLEIARQLGGTLDLREVLPKILESLFTVFPQADRGFVLLLDPDTGQLVPRATHSRRPDDTSRPAVSRQIVQQALKTGRALLSADVGSDARFDMSQSVQALRMSSIMCVPLLGPNNTGLGVIQIETRDRGNAFREQDLEVLICAATQAARAVELAQLHKERHDLEAATQIQKSFLPRVRPRVNGLSFFDYYASARTIGGDYFDYIPLPNQRLAITLGDVSGKGVPAALMMARLSAAARFALASEPNLSAATGILNRALTQPGAEDRFVTFVAGVVDLNTFALTLVNAGHPPPLLRRAGRVEELTADAAGLPLAVFDRPYESSTIPLAPGDVVVLYTDGISEARNQRGELYGIERISESLRTAPAEVPALGEALLADVRRFAEGRPPGDDLTLVCFGRTA
jgi:serine phosphatase RsbU (regulator of sigma subunit)